MAVDKSADVADFASTFPYLSDLTVSPGAEIPVISTDRSGRAPPPIRQSVLSGTINNPTDSPLTAWYVHCMDGDGSSMSAPIGEVVPAKGRIAYKETGLISGGTRDDIRCGLHRDLTQEEVIRKLRGEEDFVPSAGYTDARPVEAEL
ncbi:MAG: hypothetical protein JHC81_03780 [Brevundimonas sp.]|uniref:hypothetical protein n=1 Tax=Brevundimonas sp. TaxID=1871086 RepID=UPI001A270488|nr:hypothetical protein [Brevundimonas sp.]MBJ7446633.1 hypothetical protein [Brevundimonas sp.]